MVTALGKAEKMGVRKTVFPALPSAKTMALGKDFFKKKSNFAECRPEGTRQRIFLKKIRTLPSAGQRALGKEFLKKNQTLPSASQRTLGKEFFLKKIQTLPSAGQGALGKEIFLKK